MCADPYFLTSAAVGLVLRPHELGAGGVVVDRGVEDVADLDAGARVDGQVDDGEGPQAGGAVEQLHGGDVGADLGKICRLRIERTAPPEPCGPTSGALHRAAVVAVARGRLAPWIGYRQGGVGYCRTASGKVIAPEALFVPGDELLVLMDGPAPVFRSLAGTLTELRVVDGRIDRDFGPLRQGMPVAEAVATLAR